MSIAYSHIEKIADSPARLARLPRIRVAQIVMDYLAHGEELDEVEQAKERSSPSPFLVRMKAKGIL